MSMMRLVAKSFFSALFFLVFISQAACQTVEKQALFQDRMLVVVGEKISAVTKQDFDGKYKYVTERLTGSDGTVEIIQRKVLAGFNSTILEAKYKIVSFISGDYNADIIDFKSYSHYPSFDFTESSNVILYLLKSDKGGYVQWRYVYDVVYPTVDGRWGNCAPTNMDLDKVNVQLNLQRVEFIGAGSPSCTYGLYADDLFELRNERTFTPEIERFKARSERKD